MRQRLIRLLALIAIAFILTLLAICFSAVALYFYLAPQLGEAYAALVIAGLALSFVIITVLATYVKLRMAKEKMKSSLHRRALGAIGPAAFKTAARYGARSGGGLGALAIMGLNYWMARRKNRP